MSGWLTKAAGKLRGEQPEQPAPFDSVCQCGVRHSGLRRRKPQRIICRSCGTALFVLPRDSYPTPSAPPPRPKKKRKSGSGPEPEPPSRFQQVATNVFQASGKIGRSAATSTGSRLKTWFLAFVALWTPLRLVLVGCVAICGLTVLYTLSSDRSEQAVMDLKQANEAARKALADHQISVAADQLAAAVVALDQLDRHDDALSRELRQLHRETIAIRDALPVSPLQIVDEANTAADDGKEAAWSETFRTQYRNRWMILDGVVSRNSSGQHSVQLPLRFGRSGREAEMSVPLADLDVIAKGGKPRRAVMAVQLVGCDLSANRRTWSLSVNPETAFLWATLGTYEEAGFVFETPEERQEVERLLTTQMRVLGLTPPESAVKEDINSPPESTTGEAVE